ncbi:predicted protein [Plenodomus lingam JN3]|uniref:Predicted protein n=1 Tax=Leptosphaeria maculans (strain JN3 / isolate v23.1.3 / race Av1-4-5-6-7-8) TaxID=985895 RepID=E4ZY06_LEPMJ|nr:predicted protein [Plenodomus lingam JN3]CBX96251.1 predicted protein [Plenodomus lingam JN3]
MPNHPTANHPYPPSLKTHQQGPKRIRIAVPLDMSQRRSKQEMRAKGFKGAFHISLAESHEARVSVSYHRDCVRYGMTRRSELQQSQTLYKKNILHGALR